MRIRLDYTRHCTEGFLTDYLLYARGDAENPIQESPEDYHFWAAIGIIAAALGRKVWLDRKRFRLYPNLYTILIAESALCRKSTALRIAYSLFRQAIPEASVFAQKASTVSLITHLKQRYENYGTSEAVIFADELITFFGNMYTDKDLLGCLTSWWDAPDYWDYSTQIRGREVCRRVCVNMLGGTTPDWLKLSLPADSIGGGFTSRIIFVLREPTGLKIPGPEFVVTPENEDAKRRCLHDLRQIYDMGGPFEWTPDGWEAFAKWYREIYNPDAAPNHLRGYYGRKGDMIIKVAMCLSASKDNSRLLRESDIEGALIALSENEEHLEDVIGLIGESEEGKKYDRTINIIRQRGRIYHSDLMRRVSRRLNKTQLQDIITTAEESGIIRVETEGRRTVYVWTGPSD